MIAGIIFQNGTADGKLHELMMPQTPVSFVSEQFFVGELTADRLAIEPSSLGLEKTGVYGFLNFTALSFRVFRISLVSSLTKASSCPSTTGPCS